MKSFVVSLLLTVVATVGAYATGPSAQGGPPEAAAPQPASFGDGDTLLRRPTPTPAAASAKTDPKEKKPLTATLGKDNTGKESMTTFASSDPKIYLVWKAETGVKGEKVRVAWIAEDTGGTIPKNKKLTEGTQTIPATGSINATSFIEKPAGGFPAGKYRVDVYDDGKLAKSLKFTIKK